MTPSSTPPVEYQPLKSILQRRSGMSITAARMQKIHDPAGEVIIFAAGATTALANRGHLPANKVIDEPGIIVKSRGYVDFTYCSQSYTHKSELWSYTAKGENVNLKYVAYYLGTKTDHFQDLARDGGVKLPQLSVRHTDDYEIPIPSPEVQNEIVEKLDTLQRLIVNLKEELEERTRQYFYYRDKAFETAGPSSPLGQVGTFVKGTGMTKAELRDEGFPAVHYGQIHTLYGAETSKTYSFVTEERAKRLKKASPGDLLIATTSEDDDAVGKAVAWTGDTEVAISSDSHYYHHDLNPKYVSYFFASKSFSDQKYRFIVGAKVRRLYDWGLNKIEIPTPSPERQMEIVTKLDAFQGLIQNIENEIEMRERQFDFYREQLLDFAPK